MKIDKVRAMLNKRIQWEEHVCPKAGHGLIRTGILLEVRGKNLFVDQGGSNDWKWLPHMRNISVVDSDGK